MFRHAAAAFGIATLTLVFAQLDEVRAESPGFDPGALADIDRRIEKDIADGLFPGAALTIVRHGRVAHARTYGRLAPQDDQPMPNDAIFRIYSMTKPIVSLAAMQLVDAGKLALDAPLHDYLPAFKDMRVHEDGVDVPAQRPITIADLLRHTSGLTYGFFGNGHVRTLYRQQNMLRSDWSSAEFTAAIAKLPLEHHPGEIWEYSMSTDVLGRVVEVVSGQPLGDYLQANIFAPLGMNDTGFDVPADKLQRVAEPNAGVRLSAAGAEARLQSGGGGLKSTVADYLRFARMLAQGGSVDGRRLVSEAGFRQMTTDQLGARPRGQWDGPGPAHGFGYGLAVRIDEDGGRHPGSVGDFWWGGYAGTYFWVDPAEELIVVYMMQAPKQRQLYRLWLRKAVYTALGN